ncbi:MAG: hypothetical protein IJ312_03130 [Treponema sp.]|nr:hypothetical protein [Treponema sp.]
MNILENFLCDIQWSNSYAESQVNEDSESYDEDSASEVNFAIGESRYEADLDSWDDMPEGYEPVSDYERDEYYDYLSRKEESEDEDY